MEAIPYFLEHLNSVDTKEVKRHMGLELACRDLGTDCPYVAHGETFEELMADGNKHFKEVHGYTDEQLNDPKMMEKAKAAVKRV